MIRIISKRQLSENLKKDIIKVLSSYIKNKINEDNVIFETDNNIIAGIKILIKTKVIDLTINRKLEKIISIIKN